MHPQRQHVQSCTASSQFITRTRVAQAGTLRIAHLCVLKQLSSKCHVSFLAAPDTDHKHKFSLTHLTYLSGDLSNTHKKFDARSIFTLRSSTAEWRINTNPISHMSLMTQRVERLSVSVLVHHHYSHARNCTGLRSNTGLFLSSTGNTYHFHLSTPLSPFDS